MYTFLVLTWVTKNYSFFSVSITTGVENVNHLNYHYTIVLFSIEISYTCDVKHFLVCLVPFDVKLSVLEIKSKILFFLSYIFLLKTKNENGCDLTVL